MRGGRQNLRFPADTALAERDRSRPLVCTSKATDNWTFKHAPLLRFSLCVRWAFLLSFYTNAVSLYWESNIVNLVKFRLGKRKSQTHYINILQGLS